MGVLKAVELVLIKPLIPLLLAYAAAYEIVKFKSFYIVACIVVFCFGLVIYLVSKTEPNNSWLFWS